MTIWVTIAIYVCFLIAIGILFNRFNQSGSDYFRGGGRASWWLVGMSTFMAQISTLTFTSNAGVAYEAGLSYLVMYIGLGLGYLANVIWFAPWFRQMRTVTSPEAVRARFGPATQQLLAVVSAAYYPVLGAMYLLAVAVFCSALFGLQIETAIVFLGIIVVTYATLGGRWGVMASDFLQGAILLAVSIVLAVACLIELGGVGPLLDAFRSGDTARDYAFFKSKGAFPGDQYTWQWALAMGFFQATGVCTLLNAQRYFAAKDGQHARKAALVTLVLLLGGTLVWIIPPVTAQLLFADQVAALDLPKAAEGSYAVACMLLLPAAMQGIVVVAMIAATLSTMDTAMNVSSAIVVRDILPAVYRRFANLPDEMEVLAGRIMTIFLGIVLIFTTLWFARTEGQGVFEWGQYLFALMGAPTAIPLLLCLFIRKVPAYSGIVSIITGFVASITTTQLGLTFAEKAFWITLFSVAGFVACLPFWRYASESYKAHVRNFFEQMERPVDFELEVGRSVDSEQKRLLGRILLVAACVLAPVTALVWWDGEAVWIPLSFTLGIAALALGLLFTRVGESD
ncbi:MAG: hypothetical protein JJU20_09655 [Opitutales bacterium]|nr:hypothetical protein [Opitutales bacterium]